MPSEERIFAALHPSLDGFRSALATTIESLRSAIDADDDAAEGATTFGADLGSFASKSFRC